MSNIKSLGSQVVLASLIALIVAAVLIVNQHTEPALAQYDHHQNVASCQKSLEMCEDGDCSRGNIADISQALSAACEEYGGYRRGNGYQAYGGYRRGNGYQAYGGYRSSYSGYKGY